MLAHRIKIMSLLFAGSASFLSAQFLAPEETVKIATPTDSAPAAAEPIKPAAVSAPATQIIPVAIPEANTYFADIAAYGRDKNIILTWHLVSGRAIDKRIQIYRFSEEPKVIHDISRGTLIAKISGEINLFEDIPPQRGTYYYGIFIETVRGLEPAAFTLSRNLVGPIAFQIAGPVLPQKLENTPHNLNRPQEPQSSFASHEYGAESEEGDEEELQSISKPKSTSINAAIRKTYLRGDYKKAIKKLKPFCKDPQSRVRAKAIFYTGLSLYRLDEYERARRYFEHALVRKYYRRNAEFWLEKTSENLR